MYFIVVMKNKDEDVYRFAIGEELWRKKDRKRERKSYKVCQKVRGTKSLI